MEHILSHLEGNCEVGDTFLPCGISGRNLKVAPTQQQTIGIFRKLTL